MCFLGRFYSCSRAEKKNKTKMGEEARECAFLVEVGGILDGSGRGVERGTI